MGDHDSFFWTIEQASERAHTVYPTNSLRFLESQHELQKPNKPFGDDTSKHHSVVDLPYSNPAWRKDFDKAPVPLQVSIIGAGLGGLATAVALKLCGHDVSVFEQAPSFGEVGAGIQVPPNSTKHLLAWGVGKHIEPHITEPFGVNLRRWKDGALLGQTKLKPTFMDLYAAPYWVLHRADYHSALLARARELGVDVRENHAVSSIDFDTCKNRVTVKFTNGTLATADLIVGADGVNSLSRTVVSTSHGLDPRGPEPTGQAAYRCTIPMSAIAANPETRWILEAPNQNLWIGPSRHCMAYSIGGKDNPARLFNLVLSHAEKRDPSDWSKCPETTKAEMRANFEGFEPRLMEVIRMLSVHEKAKVVKWPIVMMKPLDAWIHKTDKLVLLGDSAHTMQPYMSQGAAMAVEDAATLAALLSKAQDQDDIPVALKLFEKVRKLRTSGMQQASWLNGEIWHLEDGEQQAERDKSMGVAWTEENGWCSNQFSDPACQNWTYNHDAVSEALKAWQTEKGAK